MDTDNTEYKSFFEFPQHKSYADGVTVSNHMTLRNACIDYRDAGGISWVNNPAPEMSAATSDEQVPCLNYFDNMVGHVHNGNIICFPIESHTSLLSMLGSLVDMLQVTVNMRKLWSVVGGQRYTLGDDGNWTTGDIITSSEEYVPMRFASPEEAHILDLVYNANMTPLSASIIHAAMEAQHYTNMCDYGEIFKFPHGAAPSAGLIGSLHDNQCIDMSPGDDKKNPNADARVYHDEYRGFICAGHTSHSTEAGRIRRVACDVRVRILSQETIIDLQKLMESLSEVKRGSTNKWTLFCMGQYTEITPNEFKCIISFHREISMQRATTFSIHISAELKLVTLSVSSGTLLKLCSSECWADNVETYFSAPTKAGIQPEIDEDGQDQLRANFSAFFNLVPFVSSDRAPRPLISSVQTPQAVCIPWCPGTASVAPCYAFSPIVTTPLYNDVLIDIQNDESNESSHLPGENVMTLYLNLPGNYEDAMLVSKRYVDNGGFSTSSICVYLLPQSEYVPPVGATLCSKLSVWWKSPCQPGCKHTIPYITAPAKMYCVGYVATGVVLSVSKQPTGDVSVRVRSHQQLQQGDKLSTGHGQKGVATILSYEDMPIAYHPKHGQITPDVVVAMSSIVTRQTNGQMYEAASSLTHIAMNSKLPVVINACDVADIDDEFTVTDASTGMPFMTAVTARSGKIVMQETQASMGFVRMFNQTQMTRERHHVSHISPGIRSVRTQTGRTRGGGVAWGEMEVQALSSSGLQHCNAEIVSRGDRSVCGICVTCQRLGLLCTCTTEDNHVLTTISEDLKTLDITTYISHGTSFKYDIAPEP